jgi:hypothetical protein
MLLYKIINNIAVDFTQYRDIPVTSQVVIHPVTLPDNIKLWTDSLGLDIPVCELFVTPPGEHTGVFLHIDEDGTDKDIPKFNWANGVGEMIWMQPKKDNIRSIKYLTDHGNAYLRLAKPSCTEVGRTVIKNETTLINGGVPHMIDYTGNVPRYCLSVAVFLKGKRPTMNEILELIRNKSSILDAETT